MTSESLLREYALILPQCDKEQWARQVCNKLLLTFPSRHSDLVEAFRAYVRINPDARLYRFQNFVARYMEYVRQGDAHGLGESVFESIERLHRAGGIKVNPQEETFKVELDFVLKWEKNNGGDI